MGDELPHVTAPRFDEHGHKLADGLLAWAHLYYEGYTPADIQRYYNRGQFIDAACNLLGRGLVLHPETRDKALVENWCGFLVAYRLFQHQEQFVLHDCNRHVVNRVERYQGTFDQRGTLHGEPVLLDLKTGEAPNWTGLQLALYALALDEPKIPRAALELHDDGTYKLIPYSSFRDLDKARLLARAYWCAQEYLKVPA